MELIAMKTRNILCAFLTLIAVGCAKEPAGNDNTPATDKRTITVNMPELTRTAIGDATQTGVSLVWNKGDEIAVIEDKGTAAQKTSTYRLVGNGGTATGTFEYVSGDTVGEVITDVVFPASAAANLSVPTSQTYVEGSFDTDAMVMSWTRTSDDEAITLAHEASALMFTVTGTAEQEISSVAVVCGETTYTLTCGEPVVLSAEGAVFYVAVPGSVTSQDYSVTFTSESGETLTKDFTHTLNAGKIGRLPAFAFETTPAVEPLKVGDYFGGGIVFQIKDGYAKVVSLDESVCYWATETGKQVTIGTAVHPEEGIDNTDLFRNREDLAEFPAAAWCIAKGDGWYMPSRKEIDAIRNGLKLTDEQARKSINALISDYYGIPFTNASYHWTCCESSTDATKIWTVWMLKAGENYASTRTTNRAVRAVRKIALSGGETADPKPESQIVNLTPTMDVHHRQTTTVSTPNVEYLRIQHHPTDGNWRYAAYFKFDVSSLNKSNFANAVLKLSIKPTNTKFTETGNHQALLTVQNTSDEWDEAVSVKWPALLENMQTTSHTVASTDTVIEIDLTALIRERLELGHQTISFRIRMDSQQDKDTRVDIYSKESTVAGTQPYLQVTTLK